MEKIFYALYMDNTGEYLHNDIVKFNEFLIKNLDKINEIGFFEVEFSEIKKTYDNVINAAVNTNLIPITCFTETIYYLFVLYKKFNKLQKCDIENFLGDFK